jgi:hypothetical protein
MPLFPTHKLGAHLTHNEAQLTEAELTLYKNISVYNFDFEQSAITTPDGKTLDYQCGCRLHVTPFSYEFFKLYQQCEPFCGDADLAPGVGSGALSRRLKNSIKMHTHPSVVHPFDEGDTSFPSHLAHHLNEFLMAPTTGDILNAVMFAPIQDLIISPLGITVMKFSPTLRSTKIYERWLEGEKCRKASEVVWKQKGRGIISSRDKHLWDDIYKVNYRNSKHPYNVKEALKLGDGEFIKWSKIRIMAVMIQFARESAEYDIAVRFVKDIDVETGIGKVSGFGEDVLRMVKELRPRDKFRSGQTGKRVYDCDDGLILPEWE